MTSFKFNVDVRVENAKREGEPYVWLVAIYNNGGNRSGFPDAELLVHAVNEAEAAHAAMSACSVAIGLLHKPRLIEEPLRAAASSVLDKCIWLKRWELTD